ncbi:MAG: response regulator [Alcanivoracaceae bacterium]|nr:response regulator [Alcanivoracaceae bacterium]
MTTKLLVLEDDTLLREQLARRLALQDFTVLSAASLQEAHIIIESENLIEAALLDQNITHDVTGNSGLSLITPILERFPQCRIVMHTGYGSIPAAVAATKKGALDYLTKPASLADIVKALRGDEGAHDAPALSAAPPSLERLEWEHIQRVLDNHDGNISAAARTLGIHRRTLQRRLKKRPSAVNFQHDRNSSRSQ